MDTVTPLQQVLGLQPDTNATQSKKELGQSDFMKIMITQLSAQDPLNPNENTDFIGQIAQFGTNDGIQKLQNTFENFAKSMHSNQALQATSLVGKTVQIPSFGIELTETGMAGAVKLDAAVHGLTVKISSPEGELVKSVRLGPQSAGIVDFNWDGKNDAGESYPNGIYRITAEAQEGSRTYAATTLANANVNSVTINQQGQGLMLSVNGIGEVGFDDVVRILSA